MGQTLLKKVWDLHTVRQLPTGQTQLFIGLHLVHEVTTPQAFDALRASGWKVARPDRTFATVDHIVPTRERQRPFLDVMAEDMMASLERNCRDFGVRFAGLDDDRQGIVHVIGPELGLTQPGMTIACGDSHTSTHGAFGVGGVRHRHVAGARRARLAVPGDGAAEGAAHPRHRHAAAGRLRQGRHPRRSSSGSACAAAPATPTSTPATPSIACRWTSG